MKLNNIPRANISPIMRMIMVQHTTTLLMVKLPSSVTDNDAQSSISYATDAARLSIMRGYKNYAEAFEIELNALDMGFEVIQLPGVSV